MQFGIVLKDNMIASFETKLKWNKHFNAIKNLFCSTVSVSQKLKTMYI